MINKCSKAIYAMMLVFMLSTLSFIGTAQSASNKNIRIIDTDKLTSLAPNVVHYVNKYCLDCHNNDTTKGDRSFVDFLQQPEDKEHHLTIEEMLDQLNLDSMPEEKEGIPTPKSEETLLAIRQMTEYLTLAIEKEKPIETPLRKLTQIEYVNSLRDLLKIKPVTDGAIARFPRDPNVHGFTNISEHQSLSQQQLGLYLTAAQENIDKALAFNKVKPQRRTLLFKPKTFNNVQKRNDGHVYYRVLGNKGSYFDLAHGELNERWPSYPKRFSKHGVHADGTYTILVNAQAIGRDTPYSEKVLRHNLSDYMKLAIGYVNQVKDLEPSAQSARHLIKVFDLADNKRENFKVTVWLPKGAIPYLHWINGPGSSSGILKRTIENYHPEAIRMRKQERAKLVTQGKPDPGPQTVFISDVYQGPRVRVHHMALQGPSEVEWPPKSHQAIVGNTLDPYQVDIPETLQRFATTVFRQPVNKQEVAHYIDFVNSKLNEGETRVDAIKLGLSAILTSPRFLYLAKAEEQQSIIKQYELANRLSYMLWRSAPDPILLDAAANSALSTPEQLWQQAQRLLADERSKMFTQEFLNAWLRIDKLGQMPPSKRQFNSYYRLRLESAMRTETEMFFEHILSNNRPISEFLTANYSFVNDGLAMHYDLENIQGENFQRVEFPTKLKRSGLLSHASVLTASANGVETSPVLRGVWLLESILGTPPPPPPPDVPTIEPDVRGATTVREQLAKHRNSEACADCHASIDPWGFALESYDPIGKLRTYYPYKGRKQRKDKEKYKIDSTGVFANGEKISDIYQTSKSLLDKEALFSRNLVKKLLTFAVGKEPSFRDETELKAIVKQAKEQGNGMKDLLKLTIESQYFIKG